MKRCDEDGFTLVELLVVVIIIGVLAVIGIPRYLSQQQSANNATAISDLRQLVIVETGLEVNSGLTDDAGILVEDEGWRGSDDGIRACAQLMDEKGEDIVLTVWHLGGNRVYTWSSSSPMIESNEVTIQQTCPTQTGSLLVKPLWPYSP